MSNREIKRIYGSGSKSQIQTKLPTACSCASCPKFNDYGESNGKGWCNLFNRPAAQHHALTADCLLNLPPETDNEDLPEEDRNICKYKQGSIVKLIDSQRHHTQWLSFIVVGQKYNPGRFRSDEAYLTEPNWYLLLAKVDQPTSNLNWVAETAICLAERAEFIETEEVF